MRGIRFRMVIRDPVDAAYTGLVYQETIRGGTDCRQLAATLEWMDVSLDGIWYPFEIDDQRESKNV